MTNENENTTVGPKSKASSKTLFLIMGVGLAAVVIILVFIFLRGGFNQETELTPNQEQTVDPNIPVASVDGVMITQGEINLRTQVLVNNNQLAGVELSADQLAEAERLALQQLVNETLILNAAAQDNVFVEDSEVEQEFALTVANFPDEQAFQDVLATNNLTEADVRQDIARQLTIQKYVNLNTDTGSIQVTDEEIGQLYDQYAALQDNMPLQEEIEDQLEQQLFQQKYNEQIDVLLAALQAAADIEYFRQ